MWTKYACTQILQMLLSTKLALNASIYVHMQAYRRYYKNLKKTISKSSHVYFLHRNFQKCEISWFQFD